MIPTEIGCFAFEFERQVWRSATKDSSDLAVPGDAREARRRESKKSETESVHIALPSPCTTSRRVIDERSGWIYTRWRKQNY
jgi:hypothetical protein